jgi:hypothetical protein
MAITLNQNVGQDPTIPSLAPSFRGIAAASRMAFDALGGAGTGTLALLELMI